MSLLLPPLENFRDILDLAVADLGVFRAPKFRLVNRLLERDYYSRPCEPVPGKALLRIKSNKEWLFQAPARPAAYREHATERQLSAQIYVVDELVKDDDNDDTGILIFFQSLRSSAAGCSCCDTETGEKCNSGYSSEIDKGNIAPVHLIPAVNLPEDSNTLRQQTVEVAQVGQEKTQQQGPPHPEIICRSEN
ncbi:hypothetical protein VTN77DRAFT_7523 [Rasamsonia byssochlamydoides]|uniref:uncharacterized protein n=1 Tax=Rasamsonia byssochlamydoides TaxID=89139 RepID=UPI003743E7AC